jgi:hypothetical protein
VEVHQTTSELRRERRAVGAEQVLVQVPLLDGQVVESGDHAGPVQPPADE